MTIKEIKQLLRKPVSAQEFQKLRQDPRVGVRRLLKRYSRRQKRQRQKLIAFEKRFKYERLFWFKNELVAGVDEVGRGPLAGPIVTAAVILDNKFDLIDVNDSKQLTPRMRLQLYPNILSEALSVGIGIKSAKVIDKINIYQADRQAMAQAVRNLDLRPDQLLVDAMQVPLKLPQLKLIKGDAKSNSIAAASIVAKVFRDQLMADYAQLYPAYGFDVNAGYGTKQHLAALKKFGPTPIHRFTFAPVNRLIKRN